MSRQKPKPKTYSKGASGLDTIMGKVMNPTPASNRGKSSKQHVQKVQPQPLSRNKNG